MHLMTREREAPALPQVGPAHPGDRPLPVRFAVGFGHLARRRPLGAVSFVLVTLVICAAVFAPFVSRYDPNKAFSRPNPDFDPALYEQSLVDASIRLKNARSFTSCATSPPWT